MTAGELARRKLGLLSFSEAAALDVQQLLPTYLAAAADPQDSVSRRGSDLLRKR